VKNRCNSAEIFAVLNITQRTVVITDVSGHPIGHIFKGQEIQDDSFLDFLTLEDGTDRLSRNVVKALALHAAWYPTRARDLSYIAAEAWNLAWFNVHLHYVTLHYLRRI